MDTTPQHFTFDHLETVEGFWDDADTISIWLEEHPGLHTVSHISRSAKVDYNRTAYVLNYLLFSQSIAENGRGGSWKRFGAK